VRPTGEWYSFQALRPGTTRIGNDDLKMYLIVAHELMLVQRRLTDRIEELKAVIRDLVTPVAQVAAERSRS